MKAIAVVCVLAVAGLALALEETVPMLPGLGSPCLQDRAPVNVRWAKRWETTPKSFLGKCVRDSACPASNAVHGYCAGMGVVCCKLLGLSAPSLPPMPKVAAAALATRPTLRSSGPTDCPRAGGACKDVKLCGAGSTARSGLCPGAANIKCCIPNAAGPAVPTTPVATGSSFTTLIPIPSGINAGLNFPSASFQTGVLGKPGCALSSACFNCNCASSALINRLKVTAKVTDTVSITGLKPFVNAVKAAFDAMLASGNAEAIAARAQVHSAGGLCCRPIKRPNGTPGPSWSNHSWGLAVDFYFGGNIDPRGDGKCQRGLAVMAPFFKAQGLYWAGGYRGADEDAMHFEASTQIISTWSKAGLLK